MKAPVLFAILFILVNFGVSAEEPWSADAERAEEHYRARDYNAAWLFYERALERSCDDGVHLFQAAESFRLQELVEDPDFSSALYAAAHHFLTLQYPDSPLLQASGEFFSPGTIVNNRFLRKTFGRVGGRAPRLKRPVADGLGIVTGFPAHRFTELRTLFSIARTQGIRSALAWARPRAWSLLFSWLLFNALTGIILPVVMAAAVSREGRKSYVTAYAFLIHWGFLGIHRFYLGRRTSGVIWLLTGGLLGLGVFFDIFLTGAYVRFWNEDHRSERPMFSGRSRKQASQKRFTRNAKPQTRSVQKSSPSKRPKPQKQPKTPKAESESSRDTGGFSFEDANFEAAPAAVAVGTLSTHSPNGPAAAADFDDLSDLDFNSPPKTDPRVPGGEREEKSTPNFSEQLNSGDFDIESFE